MHHGPAVADALDVSTDEKVPGDGGGTVAAAGGVHARYRQRTRLRCCLQARPPRQRLTSGAACAELQCCRGRLAPGSILLLRPARGAPCARCGVRLMRSAWCVSRLSTTLSEVSECGRWSSLKPPSNINSVMTVAVPGWREILLHSCLVCFQMRSARSHAAFAAGSASSQFNRLVWRSASQRCCRSVRAAFQSPRPSSTLWYPAR